MGSGKSSLGKKLANKLGYSFVDLDQHIENNLQQSITELFAQRGEEYFRAEEAEQLRKLADLQNCIISVGGGTPVFHENMTWMNAQGKTVYLKLNSDQLLSRLNHPTQISKRPLLQGKSDLELELLITSLLNDRSQFYEQAQIILEGFGPHDQTLPNLLQIEP